MLVDEMIRDGLLREVGVGDSSGGRKPILLAYNYQAYVIAGAVFEGSKLEMAIADLQGEFLARCQAPVILPAREEDVIRELEAGLSKLLQKSGLSRDRLLGIGMGLPGVTQQHSGTVSFSPTTGWMSLPIQQHLEERLGIPVMIDNDVNMMTLGECARGAGAGCANVVYMYVGMGIGAGLIMDGQFFRGSREAAGEIGYMMIGPSDSRQGSEFGVFEKHYSVPGILQKAKGMRIDLHAGSSVVEQLIQQKEQGNPDAAALLEDTLRHWSYCMANIISMLNPELFILSGEMARIDPTGLRQMHEWLSEWVPVMPRLVKASLGEDAGLIGAVHSVLGAFPFGELIEK